MKCAIASRVAAMALLTECALGPASVPALAGAPAAYGSGSAAPGRTAPASRPRFVREAQRALEDLGYPVGPVDGIVGPRTRSALLRYQEAEGLPITGRLDSETMVRLDIHERLFRAGPRPLPGRGSGTKRAFGEGRRIHGEPMSLRAPARIPVRGTRLHRVRDSLL
jgi:peptidoglycan hydrolase-like protein with peptidoglycan-binding domain